MEGLLYLGDVEVIQFQGQAMRRGEQRFDKFLTDLKRYEHVESDTFDLFFSPKQKVRVELRNDGTKLVLKKLFNKTTKERKTNGDSKQKYYRGKGKADPKWHELQTGSQRPRRHNGTDGHAYRSQCVKREDLVLKGQGPDEFLDPTQTLERWAREKGVRIIWQK